MTMPEQTDTPFAQVMQSYLWPVIKPSLYLLCLVSVALFGLACTIANDDLDVDETPPTDLSFQVLLPSGLNAAQVASLWMEVWIHDLDDSPFDNGDRDSDQIDTASPLLSRVMVRDQVPSDDVTDERLTFDIDLSNSVSSGNNLVFSVLLFPASDSTEPTFVARQGALTLPDALGQTVSLTLGAVELVQFNDTTVSESMANAVFTGTLTPSSPRAVVLNIQTQDGTAAAVDAAVAGEDYETTSDAVRFEPGITEDMIVIPIINDIVEENTERFDVQIELDLQFPTNNRAFIVGGRNGGTFVQLAGTITDEDSALLPPPPDMGIRLEVLLPDDMDTTQIGESLLEVWMHDVDDSPFDAAARDIDQVDIAAQLLDGVTVREVQLSDALTDRLLFDLDFANGISAGDNLLFSVLLRPMDASVLPTLVARQGNFDLPDVFGQTISMTFGAAEIVQIDDTSVDESTPDAVFLGTIDPSSPRAVVLNFETRDGTSPQFDAALAGEDYTATTGMIRFEVGAVEGMLNVPIIDDDVAEPTETFEVLVALDIRSANDNRVFIAGGRNGGTLGELTGTITDEDDPTVAPPPAMGLRLAVTLPPELDAAPAGDQWIEMWLHDIDDVPFTNGARDRDQIDIALMLQDRVVVRDIVLNGDVADPLTFDLDFENALSIGDNLVVSVLMFPTDTETSPTFVARQGPFSLEEVLGQTINLILGAAEMVQFDDATVSENVGNAALTGTLTPASSRAVEINFRTQNGTTPQVSAARAGEDYNATNGVVRFDPGEMQESIVIAVIDDMEVEPTESFDVQLELDLRFPSNNRAFIASGLNGGTFGQRTATITDND